MCYYQKKKWMYIFFMIIINNNKNLHQKNVLLFCIFMWHDFYVFCFIFIVTIGCFRKQILSPFLFMMKLMINHYYRLFQLIGWQSDSHKTSNIEFNIQQRLWQSLMICWSNATGFILFAFVVLCLLVNCEILECKYTQNYKCK